MGLVITLILSLCFSHYTHEWTSNIMSYQVFAIKTRPQSFSEVIGQEPIVSALQHALLKNKLHHAYLFTGTRGVGKTTIARIIAKALNCLTREAQQSFEPCNQCENCISIAAGNFPDLIEIDAASKTKVEDTRALLDTVIYAPTQGKYKIYLIDEVHMLSTHSFNALLKTLEEPPPYVKFLFATTNPDKIPATIVSRCLQFMLKWVNHERLAEHIENILQKEHIKYDLSAVDLIAQAANGSVRDALSLLEQAVAIGAGEVTYGRTLAMLGRSSSLEIVAILDNIVNKDSHALINQVNNMVMTGVDFSQLLTQLIGVLHQLAVFQQAPELATELGLNRELGDNLNRLASLITPEDVQIYYQIALLAKRDLPYSPQPKLSVEMALIRMLKFVPYVAQTASVSSAPSIVQRTFSAPINNSSAGLSLPNAPSPAIQAIQAVQAAPVSVASPAVTAPVNNWADLINKLDLKAISLQLIKNCEFVNLTHDELVLNLDQKFGSLLSPQRRQEIEARLQHCLQKPLKLTINVVNTAGANTPAAQEQENQKKKYDNLVANLQKDPNIKEIMEVFNGELRLDSVELTD